MFKSEYIPNTSIFVTQKHVSYFLNDKNEIKLYRVNHSDNTVKFIARFPSEFGILVCVLFWENDYVYLCTKIKEYNEIWNYDLKKEEWYRVASHEKLNNIKGVLCGWRKDRTLWLFSPMNQGLALIDFPSFEVRCLFPELGFPNKAIWNLGIWQGDVFYYVHPMDSCVYEFDSRSETIRKRRLETERETIDDCFGAIALDYSKEFFWLFGFQRYIYKWFHNENCVEKMEIPQSISYSDGRLESIDLKMSVFHCCVSLPNITWFFSCFDSLAWYIEKGTSEFRSICMEGTCKTKRINFNRVIYVRDERYIGIQLRNVDLVIELDGLNKTYEVMKYVYARDIVHDYLGNLKIEEKKKEISFFLDAVAEGIHIESSNNSQWISRVGTEIYRKIVEGNKG